MPSPVSAILTERLTAQRLTKTRDDRGYDVTDWSDHVSNISCHWFQIESRSNRDTREVETAQLAVAARFYHVIIPSGTDINEKDRISRLTTRRGAHIFSNLLSIEGKKRYVTHDILIVRELEGQAIVIADETTLSWGVELLQWVDESLIWEETI